MEIMEAYGIVRYGGECPECGEWYNFDDEVEFHDEVETTMEFKCPECGETSKVNLVK